MTQLPLDFDISRGFKNPQSERAHDRIAQAKPILRDLVANAIEESGKQGLTLYELAEKLKRPVHSLSGRITELVIRKRIVATEETRTNSGGYGCAVYVSFSISTAAVKVNVETPNNDSHSQNVPQGGN